jgi:hypothetical protein
MGEEILEFKGTVNVGLISSRRHQAFHIAGRRFAFPAYAKRNWVVNSKEAEPFNSSSL